MSEINMRLSPEIITGLEYKKFRSNLMSLALGHPSKYAFLREKVLESIESDIVKLIYNTFYNTLTLGQTASNAPIRVTGAEFGAANILPASDLVLKAPHYPTHLINNLALECVADIETHLQKIVDIIIPQDFDKISSTRMALSGRASSIQGIAGGGAGGAV